ncbi:hypothetical protein [Cupriavidus malaysiensis]|uniref:Phage-related membrane protein n=1 Tax=Cupriavidus malaysiensis TaxID=367825 RepID=A0ABN4TPG3_9BURK|nr:hypothetical protein [Cupriavidus malaysiensis]AOZ06541.1 hypothetical protein BKK80_12460 [Cupriavidus malaysiensis]
MSEPISGSAAAGAAGTAIAKYFGVQLGAGAIAAALGFMVLWPKTKREGFARLASSIMASIVFGPAVVAFAHARMPDMFNSARAMGASLGMAPEFGMLYASAPFLVIAGLPAWWVIGAVVRWFEKRRGKDIAELMADAKKGLTP